MKAKKLTVHTEQDVHKVLEELRATLYSIGDGVITTDAVGHITRMNPVAESLTGWSETEALGKPLTEVFLIINENTRCNVESPVERVLRDGQLTGLANHTLLIAKDGTERPIADSGAPIRGDRGHIAGVVLVFRDQTAERATQRTLQESEERHRTVADYTYDWEYWVNPDGNVLYMSPSCERITGYRPEEFVADPDLLERIVHPDDRQMFKEHESIGHHHDERHEIYFRIFRRDGEVRWIGHVGQPICRPDGTSLGLRVSNRDITDRKRAEGLLHNSENRLNEAQRIAHIGSWELDLLTNKLEWSLEIFRIFEIDPKQFGATYEAFLNMIHPEDRDMVNRAYTESVDNKVPYDIIHRLKFSDGRIKFVHERCETFYNEESYPIRSIGTVQDISERRLAEDTLRLNERRYRMAQALGHVGSWEYNLQTTEFWGSDEAKRIYGFDIGQPNFTTEEVESCIPERERVHQALVDLLEADKPYNLEFEIHPKDSSEPRIITSIAELERDEHGDPLRVVGVIQDITQRKLAENALRRSEKEKTILNQIANFFLTISDEEIYGEILAVVLQVMESKFGVFGFIAENGDLVMPSLTREIWRECQVPGKSIVFPPDSWGNSLWGRAITEKKTFCSDGPFCTPKGHLPVDHFLAVPIVYGQETIGLISVANKDSGYTDDDKDLLARIAYKVSPILYARSQRDAQERRRITAEENLRASEEKYRLLITNADEAIFIIQDEVIKFPNPKAQEMSGHSMEELAGMPFVDLVHPGDKDTVIKTYLRIPESEQLSKAYPFRIINKKRKEMWVQLTIAPIIWENEQGILCFLRDVTREKKLEAQFMQAQKMEAVGRLAGGVAHDFNNMLGVIMGYTELALGKVSPSQPLFVELQEIKKSAERSANLTRQLLAFARKQTVTPKVLDLNETVEGMLKILRRLIGEDINLAWLPGPGLWPVKMDPSQIDQILANLCVNARDAIAGVGKVTIETHAVVLDEAYSVDHPGFRVGEYILLAVSDNGCGMDKMTLDKLFEPFFTTKEIGKGTGLGLATVYGIVKQNNGFINIYSEPEKGSTFKIYIPRFEGAAAVEQIQPRSEPERSAGETVLLVEDDLSVLQLSQNILEQLGYKVLPAKTPVRAIQLAEEYSGKIDLLISDVVMPEMNGRDLAKRLLSTTPTLKQLFMSGYTGNVIAHHGLLDEGVNFIQKPFSIHNLAAKVREVLNQKST